MPIITASELLQEFIGANVGTGDFGLPEVPDNWGNEGGGYISDWNPVGGYTDPTWGGMSNQHGIYRCFAWWVILSEKTYNPNGANFRVQLRQMRSYRRVSGSWTVNETMLDPRGGGKDYRMPGDRNFDFDNNNGTDHFGYSGRLVTPASGGVAIELINDWAGHGFPLGFMHPNYSTWEAVGTTLFGRFIPKDASLSFDWESYRVGLNVGFDNYGDSWVSEHCHGRFKRLTNKWQVFASATVVRPNDKPDQGPGLSVTAYNTAPMPIPPEDAVWLERGVFNTTTNKQTLVLRRSAAVGSNKTYNLTVSRGSFTAPSSVVMNSGSSSVQFEATITDAPSSATKTLYISDGSSEDHWGTFLTGSGTATGDTGGTGSGGGSSSATAVVVTGMNIGQMMASAGAAPLGAQKQQFTTSVSASLGAGPIFEIRVGTAVKYRTNFPNDYLVVNPNYIVLPEQLVEPPSINIADPLTASNCVMAIRSATNAAIEVVIPLKVAAPTGQASANKALDGVNPVRFGSFQIHAPAVLDQTGGSTGTSNLTLSTLANDMTLANENFWGLEQAPNTDRGTQVYAQITVGINRTYGNSGYPNAYLSDSTLPGNNGVTLSMTDAASVRCLGWYVAGRAKQSTVRSSNSRVQLRNHKLVALLTDNTWLELASSNVGIEDTSWHANFWSPGNEDYLSIGNVPGSALYQYRNEPSANGGGQSLGSIGYGGWGTVTKPDGTILNKYANYALHGYPLSYTNTRRWWIDNVRGFIQYLEARLIIHDPNAIDDRANANILIWSGADWYVNNVYAMDGAGVGRLKLVTTEWRVFSWHNLNSTLLTSFPPPGFS